MTLSAGRTGFAGKFELIHYQIGYLRYTSRRMLVLVPTLVFSLLIFAIGGLLRLLLPKQRSLLRKWTLGSVLVSIPLFPFFLAPLILSSFLARSSTRPMDRSLPETPSSFDRPFRAVQFQASDGVSLSGWFLPGELEPAFVLGHGLFRNRHEVLQRASAINAWGHPALLLDFRNHGESGQKVTTLGFSERLDVQAAHHFIQTQKYRRAVYFGVSMGAVAAIHATAQDSRDVAAVIADSPFKSFRETIERHSDLLFGLPHFPFTNIVIWNLSRLGSFEPEQHDTIRALSSFKDTPVLLIYGGRDDRLPAGTSQAIFASISNPNGQLHLFPGASHGAAFQSDSVRYLGIIRDFVAPLLQSGKSL